VRFTLKLKRRIARSGVAVALAFVLAGCATGLMDGIWGDDKESSSSMSAAVAPDMSASAENADVAKAYNEALALLNSGSTNTAIKQFAEVERKYPYSNYATQSILMQAYANYRVGKWGDSINAANRFITLHPGHRDVGYAYYLIAICNYNQIADTRRDQAQTLRALAALEEVAQRFPGTAYAADVERKVTVARDHLAGKEMEVGRYYFREGAYLAGINRFKRVVTDYQKTNQTPEALYRLTEGYMALGILSEAQTAAAVLGANYPQSEWYRSAYQLVASDGQQPVVNEQSWISKAFDTINPM
jgi:outer membrane protein assembly factor BamD